MSKGASKPIGLAIVGAGRIGLIRATDVNWSGPIGAFWTSAKTVLGPVPPKSRV